jgi:hypothetical protein
MLHEGAVVAPSRLPIAPGCKIASAPRSDSIGQGWSNRYKYCSLDSCTAASECARARCEKAVDLSGLSREQQEGALVGVDAVCTYVQVRRKWIL